MEENNYEIISQVRKMIMNSFSEERLKEALQNSVDINKSEVAEVFIKSKVEPKITQEYDGDLQAFLRDVTTDFENFVEQYIEYKRGEKAEPTVAKEMTIDSKKEEAKEENAKNEHEI